MASTGSKVAVVLARMGVSNFYLVDSDVFKVGNLVRNELDWGEVGAQGRCFGRAPRAHNAQVSDRWVNQLEARPP